LAAKSSGTVLVPTSELFRVVKYADEVGSDTEFVANCRRAILGGSGIVQFPATPEIEGEEATVETTLG
jgi:cytochrome c551/c552